MSAKVIQHDALTGETIEREATVEELANMETIRAEANAEVAEAAAREALRSSALAKLGLTADEVAALFG